MDERRAALVEVGKRVFSERAYDDVSTDELAELAGVSKGLLYHYFASKRGFYVATLREAARDVLQATEPEQGLPGPVIAGALHRFLDYVDRHARLYRALVRGGIGSDAEVGAVVEGVRRTNQDRVLRVLGIAAPSAAVRARVYGWIGFVECVVLDRAEHEDLDREETVTLLLDALLAVMGAPV